MIKANRKKITSILKLLLLALSTAMVSCHTNEPETPSRTEDPEEVHRTVLVYMVATNTLGSGGYDDKDFAEMQEAVNAGDLQGGRLLAYHSAYNAAPMLLEIRKDRIDTLVTYEKETVSVTIAQMKQVLSDAKEKAPAEDYGLVLWSHSLGWLQDGIADENDTLTETDAYLPPMAYSFGLDGGKQMNITALAKALDGENFSFVYFDCCFMGSVEVFYQMRNATKLIGASPTEDPIDGMPYHLTLKYLFQPEADLIGAAKTTFDYYMATYSRYDCPISMSVVDTQKLDQLAEATKAIYAIAEKPMPEGYEPQRFSDYTKCHYFDFEDYIKALIGEGWEENPLYLAWSEALNSAVLYKDTCSWIWGKYEITRYGGLSTYIMANNEDYTTKGYNQLSWYADVASLLIR